jgi:hypothetical protein
LVLFAGALVAVFLVAALAFDVGSMLLERRTEQNVADAAALAGARYVQGAANFSSTCPAFGTGTAPVSAACLVAHRNNPSLLPADITVNIPPIDGNYRGVPAVIQVRIKTNHSSIFAGVIGRLGWPVGVNSVAADQHGVTYGFGMLALDPTACKAIQISGTGVVTSAGNVQANSDGSEAGCGGIGFSRSGGGVLTVTADAATCRSAGSIQDTGAGSMTCAKAPNSFALPDPLRNLPAPPQPALAPAMKEWVGSPGTLTVPLASSIPASCPGATLAPSATSPQTCVLGNGNPQKNRVWVMYPGLYPAGLDIRGGVTVYLTPGLYWIGGGGIRMSNDITIVSVDDENDRTKATCAATVPHTCTGGGGVLIYNSKLPASAAGPIDLGGSGVTLSLMPMSYAFGATNINLVLFQDRTVALAGDDITLNGSSSQAADVRGIIYAPQGDVKVNGSASVFSMDQVIANTFKINGSGGTVNVLRETGVDAKIEAVGLVE